MRPQKTEVYTFEDNFKKSANSCSIILQFIIDIGFYLS